MKGYSNLVAGLSREGFEMVHYDKILNIAVQLIEQLWEEEKEAVAYVIQNVYGKLQVYIVE